MSTLSSLQALAMIRIRPLTVREPGRNLPVRISDAGVHG